MLTTWRQDSLSQLLECRRHLLYEEKALQLKVTQGTAIRIVSEAVCKVSIKLCRDIGQKADEQLAQLKRRLNASTLKDILEKDLNASDEMSEWLLAMVVHVLRNRSEWHANDRQKLAREVQAFLPTVSEAVRNSSIAQDARTEASSAWQAVLSGAVAGGTVGLIGGPEGVVVGAASGAAVAAVNWLKDSSRSWVTGNRGSELRRMELEFMALDKRGEERLLIFSVDSGSKTSEKGRAAAERLVNEMIQGPGTFAHAPTPTLAVSEAALEFTPEVPVAPWTQRLAQGTPSPEPCTQERLTEEEAVMDVLVVLRPKSQDPSRNLPGGAGAAGAAVGGHGVLIYRRRMLCANCLLRQQVALRQVQEQQHRDNLAIVDRVLTLVSREMGESFDRGSGSRASPHFCRYAGSLHS
ncbi:hypothetical protein AK812_SmicGene442 [Symbiodinium microadriaticum]|uniref:Uncharacterized protein n=1 Tax=Symbiodinium microadriaticum TaxID=2951 RepID=A0A1Q9F6Q5_SYMMI|nr:hypothetical protein AK812_SmicGene442 [Symbiodinium microadriaticum]